MSAISNRVLLVDDEKDFVEMLALRLEAVGEAVTPAYSGRECLGVLADRDVDVVILDIKMPGMNGIETLREIKRRFPRVEVIMMTGHGTLEAAREGQALGAYDTMVKPADFDELLAKVRNAGERRRKQNALESGPPTGA